MWIQCELWNKHWITLLNELKLHCITVTRPSALVRLAAFLDHSAGQQNRLNSGLFIVCNWHWCTPPASFGDAVLSFGEIWSCRPVTVAIHSMHIQLHDGASFVVWRSSETSVDQTYVERGVHTPLLHKVLLISRKRGFQTCFHEFSLTLVTII